MGAAKSLCAAEKPISARRDLFEMPHNFDSTTRRDDRRVPSTQAVLSGLDYGPLVVDMLREAPLGSVSWPCSSAHQIQRVVRHRP